MIVQRVFLVVMIMVSTAAQALEPAPPADDDKVSCAEQVVLGRIAEMNLLSLTLKYDTAPPELIRVTFAIARGVVLTARDYVIQQDPELRRLFGSVEYSEAPSLADLLNTCEKHACARHHVQLLQTARELEARVLQLAGPDPLELSDHKH